MAEIQGHVIEQAGAAEGGRSSQVAIRTETAAPASFNPLDCEPVSFKKQLEARSENYDSLAMHLRNMLVPDKDFGRIHVANKNKCPEPWHCTPEKARGHWSGYQLFAAGADKVLGILGLGVHYPNEQDFIRAALTGKQILDVIMKCHILSTADQVVAEGMGACGRDEVNGSLNNAIKRACKRARVDAVLRLPAISALFEDDFLASVARSAKQTGGNATSKRAQRPPANKWDTGATLYEWPFQKPPELVGMKFRDMQDETLTWIVKNMADKPDIHRAALRVLEGRQHTESVETAEGSAEDEGPADRKGKASGPGPGTDDWLAEYDREEAIQTAREAARSEDE